MVAVAAGRVGRFTVDEVVGEGDAFAGVEADMEEQVEWGLFQKVGDKTSRRKEAV